VTRIVAGSARGRRLKVAESGTRPTSDRAREALFSALESQLGGISGMAVLDLYAGSGALGLEALSRGAERADFVESARPAIAVLRQNVAAVGLAQAHLHPVTVERWVREPHSTAPTADLVFIDPPYAAPNDQVADLLTELAARSRLSQDAVIVVERPTKGPIFAWPPGFSGDRDRRYGEATLWFGRFDSVAAC